MRDIFNDVDNTINRIERIMRTLVKIIVLLAFFFMPLHAEQESRPLQRGSTWDDFVYPKITVVDKDHGTTEGSRLVKRIIPDLETFIQDIAKGVCQSLYKEVNEVPYFEELIFELEHHDGVAYKAGNPPRITINISTKYLESQYAQNGEEAIFYEIAGVNWHELTHAYQHEPRNAGGYSSGTEFFGFIEGSADAVRILAGYHNTRTPYPGGNWRDGYTTSGFFIEWIQSNLDEDFLYKLNQSCLTINPWSYEEACQEILGESVQDLWNRYQWYLNGGSAEAVARFKVDKELICRGESVQFTNTSFNEPDQYLWSFTGGDITSSSEVHPVVTYETAGTFDVSLTAGNSNGSSTNEKNRIITVADVEGTMTEITRPDGTILTDAAQPFFGEEVDKLLDNNPNTKLCVQTGSLWIQYDSEKESQLYAYSFTSARDAEWRDPQSWTLSGSADGTNWQELDQQDNITFSKRQEKQLFTVNSSEKYRFYRFDISALTDTMFQLADIVLHGVEQSNPTSIVKVTAKKTGFQVNLRGSTLHLSQNFHYNEIAIYNLRGIKTASFKGGNLSGNAISLNHLARGCYIMRVRATDSDRGERSFSSSFILK